MNRHTDPIMSREYKLMLDVSKFSQTFEATANDFIRHFAEEIEQAGILDSPLELEEAPLIINDDKSVEVRFFRHRRHRTSKVELCLSRAQK